MITNRVALLALAFLLLTAVVHIQLLQAFDFGVTLFVQQFVPNSLALSLAAVDLLGSFEFTATIFLVYLLFFIRPSDRMKSFLLFALAATIPLLGKHFINQPVTPLDLRRYPDIAFPTVYVPTPFSFPSGHATRSIFILVVAWGMIQASHLGKSAKATLLVALTLVEIILLIGLVYLGDHWMSDVVGGILLGSGLALPLIQEKSHD